MILSFMKQFIPKIEAESKIHTIREDPTDRWKSGRKIHFATGVRTSNYTCFKEGVCLATQTIKIRYIHPRKYPLVMVDGLSMSLWEIERLAENDGFNTASDFLEWFDHDFTGKIIHWTDYKYMGE